ncbi:hypothetical protein JCM16358_16290 [Halanaerocella petrolearia]
MRIGVNNNTFFRERLLKLSKEGEEVIVVIQSGGLCNFNFSCCCKYQGIICQATKDFIILIDSGRKIFILIDAIVSVIIGPNISNRKDSTHNLNSRIRQSQEDRKINSDDFTKEEDKGQVIEIDDENNNGQIDQKNAGNESYKNNLKDIPSVNDFSVNKQMQDKNIPFNDINSKISNENEGIEIDDEKVNKDEIDNCGERETKVKQKQIDDKEESVSSENEGETRAKVYGYGRKIRINFEKKKSMVIADKINMLELSLVVYQDTNFKGSFINYFCKEKIGGRRIELLVSPAKVGRINSVTYNQELEEIIIKGEALVYIDDQDKEVCNFNLKLTEDTVNMEINCNQKEIKNYVEGLTGICQQSPFTITKFKSL